MSEPTASVAWDKKALTWRWTLSTPDGKTLTGTADTQLDARDRLEEAHRPYRGDRDVAVPAWYAAARRGRVA